MVGLGWGGGGGKKEVSTRLQRMAMANGGSKVGGGDTGMQQGDEAVWSVASGGPVLATGMSMG